MESLLVWWLSQDAVLSLILSGPYPLVVCAILCSSMTFHIAYIQCILFECTHHTYCTHMHTHTTHMHTHTHTHHMHTHTSSSVHLVLADAGQVQAKGLEPVYSQSKTSVGEVASLKPDFTLDLRAAGCLAVDGHRWPPIPQPTQTQGVRWKMVDG